MKVTIKKDISLKEYLEKSGYSQKKIKNLFKYDGILVNNKVVKQDILLKESNHLEIVKLQKIETDLDIIYEDKDIIVVNKRKGLLTISTDREKEKTLYYEVSEYLKKINKNNRIFIVHRLDKDTSGLILFAKTEKMKKLLQDNWNDVAVLRNYVALVHGSVDTKSGTIVNYLKEEDINVYITTKNEGKEAITSYEVINKNSNNSLLNIEIKTGRKNQIRCAMKSINHPIIGDLKYGIKTKEKRMYLHANKLVIINPLTNKKMTFESIIPKEFNKRLKGERK